MRLGANAPNPVFFFFGSDELALKEKVQSEFKINTQELGDRDLEVIDGALTPIEEILISIQTPPLFGSQKLIWVKNLSVLEKTHPKDESQFLTVIKGGLPKQNILILTSSKVDQRKKIVLELKKNAHWEEVSLSEEWFKDRAQEILETCRKKMDPKAYEILLSLTEGDPGKFKEELQKIITYTGSKKLIIEADDVWAVASLSIEEPFFNFVDKIVSGEVLASLKTLARLMLQGESPLGLVTHLMNSLRILIQARSLIEEGYISEKKVPRFYQRTWLQDLIQSLPEEILSSFPHESNFLKQHPYRAFLFLKLSLNFTRIELRDLFLKACKAYWELVSSRPPGKVLERLALETTK